MGEEKDISNLSPFLEAFGTEIKIDALLEHIGGKDFYNEYLENSKLQRAEMDAAIEEHEEMERRRNRQVNETYGLHEQDTPMTAQQMDELIGSLGNTLTETLGAFAAQNPNIRIHRPWADRNTRMYEEEIARMAAEFDDLKDVKETKSNPFAGTFHLDKRQKQEYLKTVFVNLISSKLNFDDDMNMVDQDGQPIKSIGQFGLFFMRLLNETLEKKRTAEENEADLKNMFK